MLSIFGHKKQEEVNAPPAKANFAKVEIKWRKSRPQLSQVYRQGLEYCFVSADWQQCCPFVFCKDFLQDAIQAIHYGKTVSIYGFTYDPKACEPLYMERIRLAFANAHDPDFRVKIPAVLDFLHQFETKLKLIRTKVREASNPPRAYKKSGVFVFDGSNRWMLSPPMLSMYSLLVRVGFCHTVGKDYAETIKKVVEGAIPPYQTNDAAQLRQAKSGIEKILQHGYARIFFKDPKKNFPDVNTSVMHNNTGIVSFSNGVSEHVVKHWHRKLEPKTKQ